MSSYVWSGHLPRLAPSAWAHPSAQLLGEVVLDEEASVWPTAVLRGDCGVIHVGARTNVQDATVAHATAGFSSTHVGPDCTVGHRVILHGCTVGARCLVGMGSILLDGVTVGDDCFIAAGSLLTPGKTFEAGSFIMGSPAKRVRAVTDAEREVIRHSVETYLQLMRSYR